MPKPELLAPAGNTEKLQMALRYGADAVYAGGRNFSLRAGSANFDLTELAQAVKLTQSMGKKIYLAVNIYAHQQDIDELPAYLEQVAMIGPDALIVSDLGVFALARQYAPGIALHISTQANTLNWQAAEIWRSLGAERVIMGRELSLSEVAHITANTKLETEIFVHGALCVAYSGRCLLSSYLMGRDANRGDCAQSCRWQYALMEKERSGEYLPIEEDTRGSYIMNSKDLCLLPILPQVLQSGVTALKIEGRNKSSYYVANTVRIYRQALDAAWSEGEQFVLRQEWLSELEKVSHHEFTLGFAGQAPDANLQDYQSASPLRGYDFVATLEELQMGRMRMRQRNHVQIGDTLEILLPDGRNIRYAVDLLTDINSQPLVAANHPYRDFYLPIDRQTMEQLIDSPLPLVVRRLAR